MLKLTNIEAGYGNVPALHGLDLTVEEGEIVTLIGANGAGKTTLLNTISGIIRPRAGEVHFQGKRIDKQATDNIVKAGISQCPEGRRVFPNMTVLENLTLGGFVRRNDRQWLQEGLKEVWERFPILDERRDQLAGTLSGGEQQMLAIGRALMAKPRLLLLDEPSLGLAPLIVREIFDIIVAINKRGTTVLLVEQNAYMALQAAARGYVIETGSIVLADSSAALLKDERVKQAYLGG